MRLGRWAEVKTGANEEGKDWETMCGIELVIEVIKLSIDWSEKGARKGGYCMGKRTGRR